MLQLIMLMLHARMQHNTEQHHMAAIRVHNPSHTSLQPPAHTADAATHNISCCTPFCKYPRAMKEMPRLMGEHSTPLGPIMLDNLRLSKPQARQLLLAPLLRPFTKCADPTHHACVIQARQQQDRGKQQQQDGGKTAAMQL